MKTIKKAVAILVLAMVTMAFTKSNDYKTYYVYAYCWGNNDINNSQENGNDGVMYITNVFTYKGSYFNDASVSIQFREEFTARYGKKKASAYIYGSGCVEGVWDYKSYNEAAKKRRKTISKFRNDNSKVRYMNNFDYYED